MDNTPAIPAHPRSHFKNWISLSGTIVAGGSFFSFVFLWAISWLTGDRNQYLGLLTFVVAPFFLCIGLALIFTGWVVQKRQIARMLPGAPMPVLTIDLSRKRDRRNFVLFMLGAFVFLLLSAFGSYQTFHYSESVEFCGTLCHTVMSPEYTTYQRGEHARVRCVECHVGGGADWFVKAKLNGAYQLYSLAFDKYNRPIPAPVHSLRPAQDTCEQCHWPERFTGNLERRYDHYLSDKKNSPYSLRLLLKVGGGHEDHGPVGGIHWHMSKANKVEYFAADEQRQDIPWVRVTLESGLTRVYRKESFTGEPPPGSLRTMDCVDCHNRPAHNYQAPNDAVEKAMHRGLISTDLPEIKRHAVAALTAEYSTVAEAVEKIDAYLRGRYDNHPDLKPAVAAVQNIYRNNFFPEMKASFAAYPNNIGHKNWAGCFRCHNDELLAGGKVMTITQNDCNSCHTILAQGTGQQLTMLAPEGMEFLHPEGDTAGLLCSDCHNGANQSP